MPKTNTTLRLLLRCRGLLRRPKPAWSTSAFDEDSRHKDDDFRKGTMALAPAIWLAIVWLSLMVMLSQVGYLSQDFQDGTAEALVQGYENALTSTTPDYPARRAALALSGVTAAITLALAFAGAFWARMAAKTCETAYQSRILFWVAAFLVFTLLASLGVIKEPFASRFGEMLLQPASSGMKKMLPCAWVPGLMFLLACVVPCVLLAGACFLLEPIARPRSPKELDVQLRRLAVRLRELDQMLYIGALALVFGTLQLSGGLSLALTSQPTAANLKTRIDFCKAMVPTPQASSPFFGAPSAAALASAPSPAGGAQAQIATAAAPAASAAEALREFYGKCQAVSMAFSKLDNAESLKQLVRGITVACGLAFSALLAAIYVPALIVLRQMIEPRQRVLVAGGGKSEVAAVDPFARIGATVATLSPLFAGLLANTLAGG